MATTCRNRHPELKDRPPRQLVVNDRISAADLKNRLVELAQRQQTDTRTDAQKWLNEPEPASALRLKFPGQR
jgi:hypothetical protein